MKRLKWMVLIFLIYAPWALATSFVFPRNNVSSKDEVFVLYTESCGQPETDPLRPRVIRHNGTRIEVDIFLSKPDPATICLAVVAPPALRKISLEQLPIGFHEIYILEYVREFNSSNYVLADSTLSGIEIRSTPNADVSGTWFDPNNAGSGLVMNLIPSNTLEPQVFVIFNAINTAGQAVWFTGIGTFVDARLEVALTQGGTNSPAGTAIFEYEGCGRAKFQTFNLNLRFPSTRVDISQLTRNLGIDSCKPPLFEPPGWR